MNQDIDQLIDQDILAELEIKSTTFQPTTEDLEEQELRELLSDSQKFIGYVLSEDDKNGKFIQSNLCSSNHAKLAQAELDIKMFYKRLIIKAAVKKVSRIKDLKLSDREIRLATDTYMPIIIDDFRTEWCDKYKFSPEDASDSHIENWIWALTPGQNNLDVAIMKHWLWQIKRNMFNKKVINPIMPILYSKKGGDGKSWQVDKLIAPLNGYNGLFVIPNVKISFIRDDNFPKMLDNKRVCVFDEMSMLTKDLLEDINRIVSGHEMSCRLLYSNNVITAKNVCSFICTSNKPLKSIITIKSQRRYFQINCELDEELRNDAEKQKEYWDGIDKLIDYDILWKSIDENLDEGYLVGEVYKEVKKVQDANINYNSTEIFLEGYCRNPELYKQYNVGFNGEPHNIWFSDLFNIFQGWLKVNFPDERVNIRAFGTHAATCNFIEKKHTNKGEKYIFNSDKL